MKLPELKGLVFQEYPARPRSSGAGIILALLIAIIGLVALAARFFNHLSEVTARIPLLYWPFLLGILAIWGWSLFALVMLVRNVIVSTWALTPLPSLIRDRRAAAVANPIGARASDRFYLLLRPFDAEFRVEILPTRIDRTLASVPEGLSDDTIARWNKLCGDDQTPPVELFDAIATSVARGTRLIAVGRRKLSQRGGAGLYRADDESWQPKVLELIERAALVFMLPSSTEGTLWELRQVVTQGWITKVIFIVPPGYSINDRKREVSPGYPRGEPIPAWVQTFTEKFYTKRYWWRPSEDQPEERARRKHIKSLNPGAMSIDGYLDSMDLLRAFGYPKPEVNRDGGLLFYRERTPFCFPIPYDSQQLKLFLEWRAARFSTEEGGVPSIMRATGET